MGTGEGRRGSLTRTELLGAVGLGAAVGLAVAVGLVAQARAAAGTVRVGQVRADPRPSGEGGGPARSELEALRARVAALEAARTPAAVDPAVLTRIAELEARASERAELDDWSEAATLGIARAVALRHTGLSPREEARLAASIVREARAADLDPQLVAAVVQVESGFLRFAVSGVGAQGLMQLMPPTADQLARAEGEAAPGPALFELERNLHLGCRYLAQLVREFGGVDRALLAYNMGPAAARKALASDRARTLLAGYPRAVQRARRRMGPAPEKRPPLAALEPRAAPGR
jgi:soluble lytic murein transglycosylase